MFRVLIIIGLFLLVFSDVSAQEKEKNVELEQKPAQINRNQMLPPGGPTKNRKSAKADSKKTAIPSGRRLISENRQKRKKIYWSAGEKLIYKVKGDKNTYKGEINKIVPGKLLVDSVEIKLSDIEMVRSKIFSQLKAKSKGIGRIVLGVPFLAVGTYVTVYSYESLDNESPTVVASALGMTLGTAINLYGLSLMKKGAELVFQTRTMKKDKGWVIKIR